MLPYDGASTEFRPRTGHLIALPQASGTILSYGSRPATPDKREGFSSLQLVVRHHVFAGEELQRVGRICLGMDCGIGRF